MIAGVALGAAAGLDRTAFGQTLLAHPFVATLVSGLLAGNATESVPAALVLWMLSVSRVPVGETRVRDWTSAAVAIPWCVRGTSDPAAWAVAAGVVVLVALAGGRAVEGVREIARGSIDRWRGTPPQDRRGPLRLHLGLTALHAARGALVVAVGIVIGRSAVDRALAALPAGTSGVLAEIWALAPLALLPLLWRVHAGWGRPRRQWALMASAAAVTVALTWGLS